MIIGSNILNKTPYGELGKIFQKNFSTNFFSAFFASMYLLLCRQCLCASSLAEFAWLVGGQGPSTRQPPAVEASIVVHYCLYFFNLLLRVHYFRVQYVNARKVKTLCLGFTSYFCRRPPLWLMTYCDPLSNLSLKFYSTLLKRPNDKWISMVTKHSIYPFQFSKVFLSSLQIYIEVSKIFMFFFM